jgi:hypothetical protein
MESSTVKANELNEGRELLDKLMSIILSKSIRLRGVNKVFNCAYLIDDFVKTY